MNKIKLWLTGGKNPLLILIFLCFLMVVGLLLVWNNLWGMGVKEGLYVNVADETVKNLDRVVDANILPRLNDVPNSGEPIFYSNNPIVAEYDGPDPDFPMDGSVLKCSKDEINGNGSYYLVSNTNPKTINLFPNDDRTIINSWSDSWGSAPSFKNCSAFIRGPKMERRIPLPTIGTDIRCKNEDSQANRHTYRVMTRTKIQQFPGYQEDPNQVVAKSWGVNEIDRDSNTVEDCSNVIKIRDNTGNIKKFKYKVDMEAIKDKLVRCRQSTPGSNPITPGNHGTDAVYKVENKKLRWYQNVANAYTSLENIISWGLGGNTVVDVPSCDEIELGTNIRYNAQILPDGTYTKCSIDVPGGVGTDKIYRVVGNNGDLSWTVSDELARFFLPDFDSKPKNTYPDCSSFKRVDDITKDRVIIKDYTTPGEVNDVIPYSCIGIHAITIGGGGGGGGGGGSHYRYKRNTGGGGAGGGGGGGAVSFFNNNYFIPVNDSNRNSGLKIVVGKGGQGGIKGKRKGDQGGRDFEDGKSTPGQDGEPSYINFNGTNYYEADGGKQGGNGLLAIDYRGNNGNGGSGGRKKDLQHVYEYEGIPGVTVAHVSNPDDVLPGGYGGYPVGIPNEVSNRDTYGRGGRGGTGASGGYYGATDGESGTNGFVRIVYIF